MNWKHEQSIYHKNVNEELMEENIIQINCGIMIIVDVNVCKKISLGILIHVVVKVFIKYKGLWWSYRFEWRS